MRTAIIVSILFLNFLACKKQESINLDTGFSEKIQNNIPNEIIEKFKEKGVVINEGRNPPKIEGVYVASPLILVGTNLSNDFPIGFQFDDFKYKFYSQDNAELIIKVDYKSNPIRHAFEDGSGIGGFVSGNNNSFTVFGEVYGQINNVPYKLITVYSGEVTSSGIKKFSQGFYMVEKTGDPYNYSAVGVGTIRVSKDADGLASKISNFRRENDFTFGSLDKNCLICPNR